MLREDSMEALVREAGAGSIGWAVLADQAKRDGTDEAPLRAEMARALVVMREAVASGFDPALRSLSGMTGGQACAYRDAAMRRPMPGGRRLAMAASRALAVAELNACMGRIVAAPTAGACGVTPGVLLMAADEDGFSEDALVEALFTAAGVGRVIAKRASISGAQGGCQAEIGSAAAMGAAALVELYGGTAAQASAAAGLALMNLMGLVCDPVGGLVEVPCVYRNVGGVAIALTAADMALAGIAAPIPTDELIDAMGKVGASLPPSLRETGEGGCAACPSCRLAHAPIAMKGRVE